MNNSLFVIERARAEDAAALLDYLKIVGGETENLSFGAEGVPLDLETEQDYLRSQCKSAECAVSRQGIWRDHRHGKSEPQVPAHAPSRRVWHQSEKSVVIQMAQNDNHMTTLELVLNMLAEASTTGISK